MYRSCAVRSGLTGKCAKKNIDVVTKRPEKPFETNTGVGLASGDTTKVYANFGSKLGKWYFQGGASYVDRDYFQLSDDFKPASTEEGGRRDNSYRTDKKISFKVGFRPTDTDEYAISCSKQKAEKGNPVYAGKDLTMRARYWQWSQWVKETFYFNSKTGIGDQSCAKTRIYCDKYENSLFGYDDDSDTCVISNFPAKDASAFNPQAFLFYDFTVDQNFSGDLISGFGCQMSGVRKSFFRKPSRQGLAAWHQHLFGMMRKKDFCTPLALTTFCQLP